jgi:hypothetical protein
MKVRELIALLQTFDPELDVNKTDSAGCNECNEFGDDHFNDIYDVRLYEVYLDKLVVL